MRTVTPEQYDEARAILEGVGEYSESAWGWARDIARRWIEGDDPPTPCRGKWCRHRQGAAALGRLLAGLAPLRQEYRQRREFSVSDAIRDAITDAGLSAEDGALDKHR